ncbi:hypothetical protein BEL04_13835 [Mucilaginibacter sp. PPCGB 2223]|uniref:hypothetical protein n=1 Tax=Mucilaginibacter sp. PPCGB 2223 TaxID=1886027 RepID=UPI000824AF84|nr:hypothetical protein [Mucilaginibacter sp. PPCGB 2223]OCX52532.1 hypothetical protein BEL04_13835 [Mucilaginibacter sp. PPCGB 2223]
MKRASVIILILVYQLSCLGMVANRFYCCGKLAAVSLTLGSAEKSPVGKHKCCKTEKVCLKIKDSHTPAAYTHYKDKDVSPMALPAANLASVILPAAPANQVNLVRPPPGRQTNPIYILNCNYRI